VIVDQSDKNYSPRTLAKSTTTGRISSELNADVLKNTFWLRSRDQFDARFRMGTAADEKTRERMGHLKWHRGQCALRIITTTLVSADPIVAVMAALRILATRMNDIAMHGLIFKGAPTASQSLSVPSSN